MHMRAQQRQIRQERQVWRWKVGKERQIRFTLLRPLQQEWKNQQQERKKQQQERQS